MVSQTKITGFEWDEANEEKNTKKHKVTNKECEESFFNEPKIISENKSHSSNKERRYRLLGVTNKNRLLTVIFTIRNESIRVISARDQSRRERKEFDIHENVIQFTNKEEK